MAYSIVWPPSLPTSPVYPYAENGGVNVLSTPMDAGPAKRRFRSQRADVLTLQFVMSAEQLALLETFVKTTLRGVIRFGFPHPRTQAIVEARIVPDSNGQFYAVEAIGPTLWGVSMTMEVLP